MKSSIEDQLRDLASRTSQNCVNSGVSLIGKAEAASRLELLWLQFLATQVTGTADCLLHATTAAIREAAACIVLGMVRPALGSLRLQIDLALSWLYFKDHKVEWDRVQATGDGFKLKKEILTYLESSYDRYRARFGILTEIRTRSQPDPYRLLSAHLHGQNETALPQISLLTDILGTQQALNEVVALQADCSEFIGDIFWSVYADQWASLPTGLKKSLDTRFKTTNQRATFFSPSGVP